MKVCSKCKKEKDESEFYLRSEYSPPRLRSNCKSCHNEKGIKSYHEDPKARKKSNLTSYKSLLRTKYGIEYEDYQRMFYKQGGVCAICLGPQTSSRIEHLCVDHCHTTGVVRGLLCDKCNRGLGMFQDDCEVLRRAYEYTKNGGCGH